MKNRHGPFRRAWLLGAFVGGLVLVLGASGIALAANPPELPSALMPLSLKILADDPIAIPVQGANRYLTAVEASKKFTSAATVVVATGEAFPDALGGAALAGAVNGPLLLTPSTDVPAEVIAEITRLGATKVYVLGGTGAVSAAVFAELDAAFGTVVRLGGASRYQTAQLVAAETIDLLGGTYNGGAFLATGANFPDALAASPLMYTMGMPLVLVDAAGGFTLPAEATDVTILGGTAVVPASVQTALGAKFETRIAGANRYATAAAVAGHGVSKGMMWNNVGIATGENFPDALCAGPLVGSKNAVLLLTTTATLSTNASSALGAHKAEIAQYYLFGGVAALSNNVRAQIATVLEAPPGFTGHALPVLSCTAAGCHDTELATIHIAKGCYMCHSATTTPSNDCILCHGATVHDATAIHAGIASAPAVPAESCTQAECHGTANAVTLHASCAQCHASARTEVRAAIVAGGATCESCHTFATVHVAGTAGHSLTGEDCWGSTCHGTDASRMHTIDFRGTGNAPPGCIVCHGVGITPSTDCLACHTGFAAKHTPSTAHASWQAGVATTASSTCLGCHGTNLMAVAPGEHIGCSCHAYAIVRGTTGCADCHEGQVAPHGFGGQASGHSTDTYGYRGMREFYDGSDAGVVVMDTRGNPIQGEWAIPTARVFWEPGDPNLPADAYLGPDGLGLTAQSAITCRDCHTGIPEETGDPHGAQTIANAGIDPNYPVEYRNAVLSHYQTNVQTFSDGTTSTLYPAKSGINYRTSWETTLTADLRIGDNDVICAKCHDLWEENAAGTASADASAAAFFGFGNFAHEEHSRFNAVGRGDCVNCHAAIPHGWNRPRLLIQSYSGVATQTAGGVETTVAVVGDAFPYANPRGYYQAGAPNGGWGSRLPEFAGARAGLGLLPAIWGNNPDVDRGYVVGGPGDHPPIVIPQIGEMDSSFIAPEWQERTSDCQAGCGGSLTRHPFTVQGSFIE